MTNQLKNFTPQKKIFDITLFSYIYKTKFVTDSWFYAMEVVQARSLEDFEQIWIDIVKAKWYWYYEKMVEVVLMVGDRGWGLVGAVSEFKLTILFHSLDF